MARALIADPDMPRKLLGGRAADIRPCVACNEDCRAFDPVLLCSVNPEARAPRPAPRTAGRPRRSSCAAPPRPPAGAWRSSAPDPAGSSAPARWPAAARSCCSTRARRSAASSPSRARLPNRGGWRALVDFYAAALERADGVELRLGTPAGADDLAGFDEVVIAIGSTELLPALPGIERALPSSTAIGRHLSGRSLLVVDDGFGWWPCASAVELGVRAGFETITVATPGAAFGGSLPPEGRVQLLARLRGAPLEVRPFTALDEPRRGQRGPEEHDVGRRRARARADTSSWSASASLATGARWSRAPARSA